MCGFPIIFLNISNAFGFQISIYYCFVNKNMYTELMGLPVLKQIHPPQPTGGEGYHGGRGGLCHWLGPAARQLGLGGATFVFLMFLNFLIFWIPKCNVLLRFSIISHDFDLP